MRLEDIKKRLEGSFKKLSEVDYAKFSKKERQEIRSELAEIEKIAREMKAKIEERKFE